MPHIRANQVDLSATPYYHCIARCVRRAFLCGQDPYTGEDFEHRRGWFVERIKLAADVFAIDVCAYAVMSNHFHIVLRVDEERAAQWSDEAVLRRYGRLFPQAAREIRELADPNLAEEKARRIAVARERLHDLSWFMRVVNEHVARRANAEDDCSGRFWEGRFKSQALLDERAVLACMSYVDLNPIRAGLASSLETSAYTSIKQRLDEAAGVVNPDEPAVVLAQMRAQKGAARAGRGSVLDIRWADYVALLEWTGRARGAKPGGRIRGAPPAILARLGFDVGAWLAEMEGVSIARASSLGAAERMAAEASRRGRRWLKGAGASRRLFRDVA